MRKVNRVGERHITHEGYWKTIIEYKKYNNITIKFDDGFLVKNIVYGNLKKGEVSHPYHPSIFGIGCIGKGDYLTTVKGIKTKSFVLWQSMLGRCYYNISLEKHPTYKGVTVCEEWKCFQNFAKWFENNHKPHMKGWQLDKDILCPDCKIYSPETCAFVPREINIILVKIGKFSGKSTNGKYYPTIFKNKVIHRLGIFSCKEEALKIYKTTKESYIKEVADKWKDLIDDRIYTSLINYNI